MPTCTADGYAIKQCHLYWCWCSTVDGIAIDDTLMLSQDMPDNYCGTLFTSTIIYKSILTFYTQEHHDFKWFASLKVN